MGSGTICAKHPPGRPGKWCMTPFFGAGPAGPDHVLPFVFWAAAVGAWVAADHRLFFFRAARRQWKIVAAAADFVNVLAVARW
jgi:hypothetical protein